MADANTREVISLFQAKGSVHDFNMFKASVRGISAQDLLLADSGYQGLYDCHKNSKIPHKKSRHHPLTEEQKLFNRALSRERIVIENINTRIKVFKILSDRIAIAAKDICCARNSSMPFSTSKAKFSWETRLT